MIVERRNGKAEPSTRRPVVLVGLFGTATDEHAVAVACRLAGTIDSDKTGNPVAEMQLVRLFAVSRDRSLESPVSPDEEAETKRLRQFANAVKTTGCVAQVGTQIERARDSAVRLTEIADEVHASFLALAVGSNASVEEIELARYVMEHAPCEVIINRVPLAELRSADESGTVVKEAKK